MPRRFFFAVWLLVSLTASQAAPTSWPHEQSDLKPDPAIIWGRLDNGLRYVVRPNAEPKGHASLRLVVFAGSLHETEAQRGLAHFIEHMAFNGTKSFPKATLLGVLQKHGIAHGPDLNAFTTLNHTLYKLDLPGAQPERLDEALTVLRDFADGITFEPDAIMSERGVIESERLARDSLANRNTEAFRKFMFPQSLLSERAPIGLPEVIKKADATELRAFYDQWYRADNMLVVVVGDFDPAAVETQLRERFASLPSPATPLPKVEPALPPKLSELTAGFYSEGPRNGAVTIGLYACTQPDDACTHASRLAGWARRLAFEAFDLRLHAARLRESKKFGVMDASFDSSNPVFSLTSLRFDANGKNWRAAVTKAEQELRRALTHGFTAAEIKEAGLNQLTRYEFGLRTSPSRQSAWFANYLADSVEGKWVFCTPEDDLALVREGLNALTPEKCLAAFRSAWGESAPRLFATGTLPASIAQLRDAYQDSARKPVAAPGETVVSEFAYTDFGPPGTVVKHTQVEDLGIHLVEFANGVKLNLKVTDFEADRVLMSARFGTGLAGEPKNKNGLRMLMHSGFAPLGLGRHDREALGHLSAGVIASLGFGVQEDAFVANGGSDSACTERLLQLFTAYLTDPGWRKSELTDIRNNITFSYQESSRNIATSLAHSRVTQLASRDPRYTQPPLKTVHGYSIADLREWVEPQLKSGPLEIGLVGDFDLDEMIALAARTVGCLPPRLPPKPIQSVKFVPTIAPGPTPLTVSTTSRHGAVQVTWAAPAGFAHLARRKNELLAGVITNRLAEKIREEMGATYSPSCNVWRSDFQPENAYFIASLTCEPGEVKRIADSVRQAADELARNGVSNEEFERARQPLLQSTPAQLRNNSYWLYACVATAQSRPGELEGPRTRESDLTQLTPAEISALAAEVLPAARASVFTAVPEKKK